MKVRADILFLMPSLGKGGAQRATIAIANYYAGRGKSVYIAALKDDNVKYTLDDKVCVVNLNVRSFSRALIPIIKLLYQLKPISVYTCLWHINLITYIALKFYPYKVNFIQSIHNNPEWIIKTENKYLTRLYYYFFSRFQKKIIVVSKGIHTHMLEVAGVKQKRMRMIYNPAITSQHKLDLNEDLKIEFVEENQGQYVVWVGRLDYQKNIDFLIEVASKTEKPFLIVGEGPDVDKVKVFAEASGGRVVYMPFQRNVMYFMKNAFCLILTSRFEGFGLVLVEALHSGIPVLSTDCRYGPSEIIENSVNGFLLDTPQKMVGCLDELTENINLYQGLKSMAKASVETFDDSVVLRQIDEYIYEDTNSNS